MYCQTALIIEHHSLGCPWTGTRREGIPMSESCVDFQNFSSTTDSQPLGLVTQQHQGKRLQRQAHMLSVRTAQKAGSRSPTNDIIAWKTKSKSGLMPGFVKCVACCLIPGREGPVSVIRLERPQGLLWNRKKLFSEC